MTPVFHSPASGARNWWLFLYEKAAKEGVNFSATLKEALMEKIAK
jgi:hypothetical protein